METINGKTFTDMKIHFRNSDKTTIVKYSKFLEIVTRTHPMKFYLIKNADNEIVGAIDVDDILFIEPCPLS